MPQEWNFADVWETIAQAVPDRPAQQHGAQTVSWSAFDAAANGVAWNLLQAGLAHQDKVALYLYNGPEYLQCSFACMKASLVPVNTNYKYQHDELLYLWDNADAVAVVFHGAFTAMVDGIRDQCKKVKLWIHVDDGTAACPDWASPYFLVAMPRPDRAVCARGRSGDDLIFIYTGGTTGRPRGVMWRQHDLYVASNTAGDPSRADLHHVHKRVTDQRARRVAAPTGLPAAPLMHGTAFVFAATILNRGGCVVTLAGRQFAVDELLDTVQAVPVTDLCIVGDAFCRPIVDALDGAPSRWNATSLKAVSSSGMMWSTATKQRLLVHAPGAILIDFLNSSEASGMGRSIASAKKGAKAACFTLGQNAFVIDDEGRPLVPGSGVPGRIAVRGGVPIGYYGDPEKTAATFPVIDGVRCAIAGDYARVELDGTITLLGRGSVSINTGGEKVFPEEVEECIKGKTGVRDALVVGVPDERFGETDPAVVEPMVGGLVDTTAVMRQVRAQLAPYKSPRQVMVVDSLRRGPNGKADYRAVRQSVLAWLAAGSPGGMTSLQFNEID